MKHTRHTTDTAKKNSRTEDVKRTQKTQLKRKSSVRKHSADATPAPQQTIQESPQAILIHESPLPAPDLTEKRDTLKNYIHDISIYSLVKQEDERSLSEMIHSKDKNQHDTAREELITSNLRLVVKIAHDFKGNGLPLQDLISEGNIGLMRAVEKFDPDKGAKFSSYAAWWIKQSMRRAIVNQRNTIRIPIQSAHKISRLKKLSRDLGLELGRAPTHTELAIHSGYSEKTVTSLLLSDPHVISLQDQIKEGEDGELIELIPDTTVPTPDQQIRRYESIRLMRQRLTQLDEREKEVLMLRFGLNGTPLQTLETVSLHLGRTRERVRQIQNQALNKLRLQLQEEI